MRKLTFAVLATAVALTGTGAHASTVDRYRTHPPAVGRCTMAAPLTRATVEVVVANASDFCELFSQALAIDVFRTPMVVTPGRLWHYADAVLSCRLRYRSTSYRMTVSNSAAACHWLVHPAVGWHREPAPPAYIPTRRFLNDGRQ